MGIYFANVSCMIALFAFIVGMATFSLLKSMRRVNQQYDRHAKHSARQRKNLVKNSKRLAKVACLEAAILACLSGALSGLTIYDRRLLSTDLEATSVIWFFYMAGTIILMTSVLAFFRSRSLPCFSLIKPKPILKTSMPSSIPSGFYLENAVASENPHLMPRTDAAEGSLYEKIGGQQAIEKAVVIFYDRCLADDRVRDFFGNTSMNILRKKQEMFLMLVTGGPALYTGKSLRESHARLNIDSDSFDIVADHLKASLMALNVNPEHCELIMARVSMFKSEVLGLSGACPVPDSDKEVKTSVEAISRSETL
jgi:truncated hemoglobin YjbI